MLRDSESEVSTMMYSPSQPVNIIFNALDDLADFSEQVYQSRNDKY